MKNTLKSVLAIALAILLLVPTVAFAQETEEPAAVTTSGKVVKTLVLDDNVVVPTVGFDFVLTPATVEADLKENNIPVYAGDPALLTLEAPTLNFVNDPRELTKETNLELGDATDLTPGIYRYTLKETPGTYDGITYDTTEYTLDVWVSLNEEGNKVANLVAYKGTGKVADVTFENRYTTKNLTVKKVIAGNAADFNKNFKFTVTVNGAEGETYATSTDNILLTGVPFTIELGHDEAFEVYGLSPADTYTVTEDFENYTQTVDGATEGSLTENRTVTFTNTLSSDIPTGVIETIAPFAIMIVVALGFAVLYFRRRQEA